VNARRDEDDVLPFREQLFELALRAEARVHQLALDLAEFLEMRERRRIGDVGGEKRTAEGRFAEHMKFHARTRFIERREIIGDLFPGRQLSVGAGGIAEDRFGGREFALLRREGGRGEEQEDNQQALGHSLFREGDRAKMGVGRLARNAMTLYHTVQCLLPCSPRPKSSAV
jgi:hypothetical protein